jgi:putative oxidoreductase
MKHLPNIAGGLLGLMFIAFGAMFLLNLIPPEAQEPPPAGSPAALFMGAFAPTGYLHFVKALELIGGLLVAIPKTRNIGLLVLGPIIINILAYHAFIMRGVGLFSPLIIIICLLAAYLLWAGRKAFAQLLN